MHEIWAQICYVSGLHCFWPACLCIACIICMILLKASLFSHIASARRSCSYMQHWMILFNSLGGASCAEAEQHTVCLSGLLNQMLVTDAAVRMDLKSKLAMSRHAKLATSSYSDALLNIRKCGPFYWPNMSGSRHTRITNYTQESQTLSKLKWFWRKISRIRSGSSGSVPGALDLNVEPTDIPLQQSELQQLLFAACRPKGSLDPLAGL